MKRSCAYSAAMVVLGLWVCSSTSMALIISDINPSGYVPQINELAVGQRVYTDRAFTFTSVASLAGSTYIQTANGDKGSTGDSFLTFKINRNCTVYVAHDTRITAKPAWLGTFTDTGANLVTTDATLRLFSKEFPAGTVTLGGNGSASHSMYSVVVVPQPLSGPPGAATGPVPANGATGVSTLAALNWTAGAEASSHTLYFGTTNPPAPIGTQAGTAYAPGTLANDTTYYWRVDAVNSLGTTEGAVWNFTTSQTNAIAFWPMDDNAASAAVVDVVGGNNGTFYSGANPRNTNLQHSSDRKEGTGSLSFDGVDDYIVLPRSAVLETGNLATRQISISAWIKHDSLTPPTGFNTIVGTGDGGWFIGCFPNENKLHFAMWPNVGDIAVVTDDTPIFDGQWHHVVAVFDGSRVHLYVDGNHGSIGTTGSAIQNMFDAPVLIGENHRERGRYWKGLIDDVRIYDYALTAEDIYHMNYPQTAWNPAPADGVSGTVMDAVLTWSAGKGALSHDVYFGTSQSAVAAARRLAGDINGDRFVDIQDLSILANQWLTSPGTFVPSADIAFSGTVDLEDFAAVAADWHAAPNFIFKGSQMTTAFSPDTLAYDTTYYWRVDQIDGTLDSPHIGRVWSFTTHAEPGNYEIAFPGTSWDTKTPAEMGLDGAKLDQFAANVGGRGCIIRQGYVVKSWGDQAVKADWASAAKPVVSTLLFYAVEEGRIPGVHAKIADQGWNLSTKDQAMEFYHLANMTSGYARGESPGARWAYNDTAINLYVKTLFDRVYGTSNANAVATAANRLGALGFEHGSLFSSRNGYGISTSVRDFARIGWLWCNKGYWNGQQLLPRHYFDSYMTAQVPSGTPRTSSSGTDYLGVGTYGGGTDQTANGPGVYGFNWWCNPNQSNWPDAPADTIQANGHWGGEVVTVIPSLSLVVSIYGNMGDHNTGSSTSAMNQNLKLLVEACPPPAYPVVPMDIPANADTTTRSGVNYNNHLPELGLLVKYAGDESWIEFTLGSDPVNQAILTLYHEDGAVPNPWTITVRGAEFSFNESTFTGTNTSGWTHIGNIPNVRAIEPVYLDMTAFYNNHLGKTVTLRLHRADPQPDGHGPVFQDRELTRQFWWSFKEGPKISIQ